VSGTADGHSLGSTAAAAFDHARAAPGQLRLRIVAI
jgi:hypothetical protein